MSKLDVENTILTALRVAPELFERRAQDGQAPPLARDAWIRSATEARKALRQLEGGALRIVEGSGAAMEKESRELFIAALREAHGAYHAHANDEQLPERIRAQFELQAAEARVVCSRLQLERLHVVQGLRIVAGSKE